MADYEIYKIQRGDNLTKIAKMYETTVNELVELNGIKNPDLIYAGEDLKIPKKVNSMKDIAEEFKNVAEASKKEAEKTAKKTTEKKETATQKKSETIASKKSSSKLPDFITKAMKK